MPTHKHKWIKDTGRKHGNPYRAFCKCAVPGCDASMQYSVVTGKRFSTSRHKLPDRLVKKVRTIRLSDADMDDIENERKHLSVAGRRITLAA